NAATRLHPKFAPRPVAFEPEILYEVAGPDEPSCLRCERVITAGSRWCHGCGLDLAESWNRYRRRRAIAQWERRETVPRPYRPAGHLGSGLRLATVGAAAALL